MIAWLKRLWALLFPPPVVEDLGYLYRPGDAVETAVTVPGSLTAEVWVPDGPRDEEWERGNILWLVDEEGRSYELRAFKIKACAGGKCGKEPRYTLPWGQWRSISLSWTANKFTARIDGEQVTVFPPGIFGPSSATLIYGDRDGHLLDGARIRNIKWA